MAYRTTDDAAEEVVVHLYSKGLSTEKVAAATGLGRMVIQRVLRDHSVPANLPFKTYTVNNTRFTDLSQEEDAYWFGFMFADSTVRRSNVNTCLSIKDISHLKALGRFLGCEQRVVIYTSRARKDSDKLHTSARLLVSDRKLADRLVSYGIEPYRPRSVETFHLVPGVSRHHFLRGWFDGDGSVLVFPRINFIGPGPFVREVEALFQKELGTNPVALFPKSKTRDVMSLAYKGVYRCMDIVNYLYRDATVFMQRKRDRIDAWPKAVRSKMERYCPTCGHPL